MLYARKYAHSDANRAPGLISRDIVSQTAGKDATEDFEYYGHSDKAREQMKPFLVGTFEVRPALPHYTLAQECLPRRAVLK